MKPRTSVGPGERAQGSCWESPQGQLRGQPGDGSVSLPGPVGDAGWGGRVPASSEYA